MGCKIADIGRSFYEAMAKKDDSAIANLLSHDVTFLSPVTQLSGKNEVLAWERRFLPSFNSLTIHTVCSNESQAMLAYEIQFPDMDEGARAAALLNISQGLITRIELFFDMSPFA